MLSAGENSWGNYQMNLCPRHLNCVIITQIIIKLQHFPCFQPWMTFFVFKQLAIKRLRTSQCLVIFWGKFREFPTEKVNRTSDNHMEVSQPDLLRLLQGADNSLHLWFLHFPCFLSTPPGTLEMYFHSVTTPWLCTVFPWHISPVSFSCVLRLSSAIQVFDVNWTYTNWAH